MTATNFSKGEIQRTVDIWLENGKSRTETARILKISKGQIDHRMRLAKKYGMINASAVQFKPGVSKVIIFTSAQDETPVFKGFWDNLIAYKNYREAELVIGGFTYQKGLFEDNNVQTGVFAQAVSPYLLPEKRLYAPGLMWCGHANILPTTVNPLAGWETMSGNAWAIIPHAKIALKSIPTMLDEEAKVIMTTGVVTEANYVQRAAGQKAEFHHTFGAVIVEIDSDGMFHTRHINAAKDGSFQDLDIFVAHGVVRRGARVEAVTWGDIHKRWLSVETYDTNWGQTESIIDILEPRYQFFHDVLDFRTRNHHNRHDAHFLFESRYKDADDVEKEIEEVADFLDATRRSWCHSVVVESNHDRALIKWLKDNTAFYDPVNMLIWHKWNYLFLESIKEGKKENFLGKLCRQYSESPHSHEITFLKEGDSFKIATNADTPIECGLHGHVGPNGSRGSPVNLSKIAPKLNTGHTHSAGIINGVYTAGVSAQQRMGYNESGPSSWSESHIITYADGKRTLIFVKDGGRWRGSSWDDYPD